jgi:hypothetical protein
MPKPPRSKPDDERLTRTGETRLADALTVFWMITVMQVVLFELATVGFLWYFRAHPENKTAGAFASLLYLCAALGGCVSLIVFPIVWRVRRTKPPLGITLFAIVAAALPILMMVAGVVVN